MSPHDLDSSDPEPRGFLCWKDFTVKSICDVLALTSSVWKQHQVADLLDSGWRKPRKLAFALPAIRAGDDTKNHLKIASQKKLTLGGHPIQLMWTWNSSSVEFADPKWSYRHVSRSNCVQKLRSALTDRDGTTEMPWSTQQCAECLCPQLTVSALCLSFSARCLLGYLRAAKPHQPRHIQPHRVIA